MGSLRPLLLGAALLLAAAAPASATVIAVTTLDDELNADGDCSLREAVQAAETDAAVDACATGSGADEIVFTVTGTIPLPTGLTVSTVLAITGPGAGGLTLLAAGQTGLFYVERGALALSGLTLAGNPAGLNALVLSFDAAAVRLTDCVLTGHTSLNSGGAVSITGTGTEVTIDGCVLIGNRTNGDGGALSVNGPDHALTVRRSTFAGNHSDGNGGAIILATTSGAHAFESSTLSGNTTNGSGGAIYSPLGGTLTLRSTTITGNTADADGGGGGEAGGLWNGSSTTLRNTIVAGNADGSPSGDVYPDLLNFFSLTSGGSNLIGINNGDPAAFPAGLPNAAGDWVGTAASPLPPLLGPLADNGGPTPTHLPQAASVTLDHGACPGAKGDQRGFYNPTTGNRPVDGPDPGTTATCDIGAVERGAGSPPAVGLTPASTTVPRGGTLQLTATLTGGSQGPSSFRARAVVTLPNGSTQTVIAPTTVPLPPGATRTVTLRLRIPGSAPLGAYVYAVEVFTADNVLRARDHSAFLVTPAAAAPEPPLADGGEWHSEGLGSLTGEAPLAAAPGGLVLGAPYPNPLTAHTTLGFTLPEAAPVRLAVYDALGREVAVLVDETREAGAHAVGFDASGFPAGTYLVRVEAGRHVATDRLTLVR